MPEPIYGLTEEQVAYLKRMLDREMKRPVQTRGRARIPFDVPVSPDIYIAKAVGDTGTGGIAGISSGDTTPDSGTCEIYRVIVNAGIPTLEPISSLDKTVYNISPTNIPENGWVLVARDKFGSWVTTSAFSSGEIATIADGDYGDIVVSGGGTLWELTTDAPINKTEVTWSTDQTAYAIPAGTTLLEVTLGADVTLNSIASASENRLLYIRVITGFSGGGVPFKLYFASTLNDSFRIQPTTTFKTYITAGEGTLFVGRVSGGSRTWNSLDTPGISTVAQSSSATISYRPVRRLIVDDTNGLYTDLSTPVEGVVTLGIREAEATGFGYGGAVTHNEQRWGGIKHFLAYTTLPFAEYGNVGIDKDPLTVSDAVQFFSINPTTDISIYGIDTVPSTIPDSGRYFLLANKHATNTITLVHDTTATGTVTNLFQCALGTDIELGYNEMALIWYDTGVDAYRVAKLSDGNFTGTIPRYEPVSYDDGTDSPEVTFYGVSGSMDVLMMEVF